MPRRTNLEEITNVSDPRDFLQTTIPELTDIDTLLRCHICKDFLKTPVLTPCGHTFCSLCIREYLKRELKCPLCLAELRESMLKSEYLVNEIVASYGEVRTKLLETLSVVRSLSTGDHNDSSLIELPDGRNSVATHNKNSSHKHFDVEDDEDLQIIETRDNLPLSKRGIQDITTAHKKPRKDSSKSGIASLLNKAKSPDPRQDLANCPICVKSFPVDFLQRTHLDECLSVGAVDMETADSNNLPQESIVQSAKIDSSVPRQSLPSLETPTNLHFNRYLESSSNASVTRLAKLNFSSMSLQQLKAKLSALKLPTTGSRQQMINRYNHYEMLWNSNYLDAINPVDERELRRRLANWESSHNCASDLTQNAGAISRYLNKNPMKDFRTDKFDRRGWMLAHRRIFRRLIKEAKDGLQYSESTDKRAEEHNSYDTCHNDSSIKDPDVIPSNQLVTKPNPVAFSSQKSTET
ncbi:LADA_0E14070g1_1 [Lachancea dasiensis]|uniref:Postreplication repair E3 ubiquitin-protein ligase RAD18 n=1 Tax=Lachancea dasiensis TaxID=1072105 RepID=A0A1G4JFS8_9SACH|nr:LADA_0E14070g1_1 [Lachancea dasiensis]